MAFKSFDIEFSPFIKEINAKEEVIRECADAVTKDRVRSMFFPSFFFLLPRIPGNDAKSNTHTEIEAALQEITSELNGWWTLHYTGYLTGKLTGLYQ